MYRYIVYIEIQKKLSILLSMEGELLKFGLQKFYVLFKTPSFCEISLSYSGSMGKFSKSILDAYLFLIFLKLNNTYSFNTFFFH